MVYVHGVRKIYIFLFQPFNSFGVNMKKTALILALAAGFTAANADVAIKLAHVGPLSGGIAHLGKDNENGAKLAIKDLNAKGVMIGGQKAVFTLMTEDDAADPKQGTAVAQKVVDAKVNGVIGHLNSGTSIPASKIYSDAGIPQISPSATNPKYTEQGFKTTFRVVANDKQLGGTLGTYAVKTLKGKSIAVITDKTAYGDGVAEEFAKGVKKAGGKIVASEATNDKATDFQAILTKIKGKKPDVVFFGGMDAVAGPMLQQMKSLGIKAKFMGGDGICSEGLVKLAGDGMSDGQVVCAEAGGVTGGKKKGMDDFKARFKAEYNADVQVYAPYVYDSVMVMVEAMKKANSAEPAKYLPALSTVKYEGVTGLISFDKKGDINNGSLTLFTYKGGKRSEIAVVK
jgi:branched-chain amino acid transport system substrate-binding protein